MQSLVMILFSSSKAVSLPKSGHWGWSADRWTPSGSQLGNIQWGGVQVIIDFTGWLKFKFLFTWNPVNFPSCIWDLAHDLSSVVSNRKVVWFAYSLNFFNCWVDPSLPRMEDWGGRNFSGWRLKDNRMGVEIVLLFFTFPLLFPSTAGMEFFFE